MIVQAKDRHFVYICTMIKIIIFDLDGTLINTIADLSAATDYALSRRGLKTHSIKDYTAMVGHGIKRLIISALEKSLGATPQEELVEDCLKDFTDYYVEHIDVHTRPYEGMPELLGHLQGKGCQIAVASNKFQAGTEKLIAEFFPDIRFTAVMGNSPELPLKPDAEVVNYILSKAGVSREECIFVGDSPTDLQTARNAGVKSIAVCWGFRPREVLLDADQLASSPKELKEILDSLI